MNKTWYDEIGVSVKNDNYSSFDENRIDYSNKSLSRFVMVISTIWMMISGFIPIIKEEVLNRTYDSWSYYGIDGLLSYMYVNGMDNNFLYVILYICLPFYAVGIVLAFMFLVKVFSSRRMVDKISFYAILSSLLLSASTIVIILAYIVVLIKIERPFFEKLILTPGGLITVAVLIINIIVAKKYSRNTINKNYQNKAQKVEKTCMMCKTKYNDVSCPVCGSTLIVK